jgi:hypothetical protein
MSTINFFHQKKRLGSILRCFFPCMLFRPILLPFLHSHIFTIVSLSFKPAWSLFCGFSSHIHSYLQLASFYLWVSDAVHPYHFFTRFSSGQQVDGVSSSNSRSNSAAAAVRVAPVSCQCRSCQLSVSLLSAIREEYATTQKQNSIAEASLKPEPTSKVTSVRSQVAAGSESGANDAATTGGKRSSISISISMSSSSSSYILKNEIYSKNGSYEHTLYQ